MTSKERVRATIARKSADRVPLGFYAADHDTVSAVIGRPTYVRNKIEIQLALWDGRRNEIAEGLKADTLEFYRKIDTADLLLPKEAMILPPRDYEPDPPKKIGEDRWEDRDGRIYQAVRRANEIQCVHNPVKRTTFTREEFQTEAPDPPQPDPSIFEVLDFIIDTLGEDRYVAGTTGGITALTRLGDTETGLMLYATNPEIVHAANRRQTARQNALDAWYIRPGVPGVLMEQDMAGSNGPLISPDMFGEMCLPYLKQRISNVKARVEQVIFHNCGNNIPLMDMFVDAGIDCYQSLQTTAGMEVGRLKELYGDRLCFWGGVPVETLIDGAPDDVLRDVRTAMERGAPGGGFILGPSHSVAMNTKYENFMAMLEEHDRLADRFS